MKKIWEEWSQGQLDSVGVRKQQFRKKIKTCNEEVLKLEKGNNLKINCSTTVFEAMKEMMENTVRKSNRVEHLRNED